MGAALSWLSDWRGEAAATAARVNLPNAKQEAWKYTALPAAWSIDDLRSKSTPSPFLRERVGERVYPSNQTLSAPSGHLSLKKGEELFTLTFTNGHYVPADVGKLPSGVICMPISIAQTQQPELLRTVLGASVPDKTRGLLALNFAEFTDGLLLYVPHGAVLEQPIHIHHHAGAESRCHVRHLIHLEESASANVVLHTTADDASISTHVSEIFLAPGARLGHYRLNNDSAASHHIAFTDAALHDGAELDHFSLTLGSALSRHEITTRILGQDATAHINSAARLAGTQHSDFTSRIEHMAPGGQSRQTVRHVLQDRARGVFQGKIHVHQIAQKTDGYQMNQALLLSPHAEMDSKPELEIYADDVKCSHGATTGALDETALFYLRSRGIALADARSVLTRAFLQEAIDLIANENVRAVFSDALEVGDVTGQP